MNTSDLSSEHTPTLHNNQTEDDTRHHTPASQNISPFQNARPVGEVVKEAERQQIEQAKFFLAAIVESSQDSIVTVDFEGRITTWNHAAEQLYGYSVAEAIGLPLATLTLPQNLQEVLGNIEKVKHSQEVALFDSVRVKKDGREMNLEVVMSPVKNAEGQVIGVSTIARDVTGRRQGESPQHEAQEREAWRLAVESITDHAVFTQDLQGTITSWNVGAQRVFGWSEAEIVGQNARVLFTPEDQARGESEKEMNTARKTGRAMDERYHLRRDGSRFFASGVLSPIRTPNGSEEGGNDIRGYVKVTRDLTQQKQTEDELRSREARFRTLADAVPQLIWTNTPEGYANYFNQRWVDYSGLSPEDSAGWGWQIMVHPDDAPSSIETWQNALAVGKTFEIPYRLLRADGVYRWHLGRNVPLCDSNDEVIGWFGTATDIEELMRAENAQRESEERYRLLVEGTRDYAMFLMDAQRRIIHWNSGAQRLFGYSPDEAVGQSGDLIFTPKDREAGAPEQEALIAAKEKRAPDNRWHQRKDGSLFWADGIMTALRDEAGNLRGFAKIARDATWEREAEEKLRQAHDELELRVQERTAQLMQMNEALQMEMVHRQQVELQREQLLHRVVTAQEEERRRLSRELHDNLGQHAAAIMISLGRLQSEEAELPFGERRQSASQLVRLQQQMEDLLSATHRLAWELRPAVLDNVGLVAALQQYVQEWAHNGITADFVSRLAGKDGTKQGKTGLTNEAETALYRVVQEALSNVLRHAQATQVGVMLERSAEAVTVIVEDNGIGFDVEATAGSKRLGVRGMQERMDLVGGSLSIEAEPGEGTTLYARVPVVSTAP